MDFTKKVVIVTGGTKGIGKEIAKQFLKEGALVAITGRDINYTQSVAQEIGALGFRGDVKCENSMNQLCSQLKDKYGRIDVMCHNAGIYPVVALEDMTLRNWQEVIDTNLTGTFLAVKCCLPFMKKQNGGKIVIISSISGPKVGLPGCSHYTASKGGIAGFIKTAAIELAPYNISINAVEPGNIYTESLGSIGLEHLDNMKKAVPMGCLGTPQNVADSVLFLASNKANYITGQSIVVDGGQTLPESHFMLDTLIDKNASLV